MLLANETVAAHVVAHDIPSLHRVHEAPDLKKVEEFAEFVEPFGYGLGASGHAVTPKDFQRLIERIHGTPEERPIAALMLRTMQKARYDPVSLGHFGLATEHYLHFTSPIRRYPDLVVHRLLREGRHGQLSPTRREELADDLPEAARHSSEMERRADGTWATRTTTFLAPLGRPIDIHVAKPGVLYVLEYTRPHTLKGGAGWLPGRILELRVKGK